MKYMPRGKLNFFYIKNQRQFAFPLRCRIFVPKPALEISMLEKLTAFLHHLLKERKYIYI